MDPSMWANVTTAEELVKLEQTPRKASSKMSSDTATGVGTPASRPTSSPSGAGGKPPRKNLRLTEYAPHPGYFLAGAIAGGVSRTATAPLDRLKVFLLVNTQNSGNAVMQALKRGQLGLALSSSTLPFRHAASDIYGAGGLRGFFAGMSRVFCTLRAHGTDWPQAMG
jgi:solute carrier family 25 phosphate transporter 23/24/25/41